MTRQVEMFERFAEPLAAVPLRQDAEEGTRARARNNDPQSSHAAAEQVEASGAARRQREQCVDLVFMHPGLTSKQLAEKSGGDLDRYQTARRLPEAAEQGLIEKREPASGRECTWWPK